METNVEPASTEIYNRKEYFLDINVEGYEEYKRGGLSFVKTKQVDMLALKEGLSLLEVGFGRGELLYNCAKKGVKVTGIDCAHAALEIARETLRAFPKADLQVADCRELPFQDNSFERVFSGDVIEHLYYEGGVQMLKEMYRVLKPGGFMLLHTAPNTVFIRFIYPFLRHILKFIDRETIRKIDCQRKYDAKRFHLYEFNLLSLRRMARAAGLTTAQVWIDSDILRSGQYRHTKAIGNVPLIRLIGSLGNNSFVRFFLGNDLYLQYHKK